MAADPRSRMIESTALLIREHGVEDTSLADVIAASDAPRGSIYHHFPGGKSLAASLRNCGTTRERALSLATLVVGGMEGAIVLARAEGSIGPLDRVVGELELVLTAAIDDSRMDG